MAWCYGLLGQSKTEMAFELQVDTEDLDDDLQALSSFVAKKTGADLWSGVPNKVGAVSSRILFEHVREQLSEDDETLHLDALRNALIGSDVPRFFVGMASLQGLPMDSYIISVDTIAPVVDNRVVYEMIHEATFDDDRAADAERKRHSTKSEALGVARLFAKWRRSGRS